ncbi:MAG: MmgE/PrpD family protein [Nitrososphaerota archaeon]
MKRDLWRDSGVMEETVAEQIGFYASKTGMADFAQESIKEGKRRILDSLAVMVAAVNAPPVASAKRLLRRWPAAQGSTVIGSDLKASPQDASLVNGIMVRYLDFNDTYLSREAIHPSDMIPALIALAEAFEASGEDLLKGVLVGYEVACALADAATIRDRGFDHVSNIAIGAAAGAAALLELDFERAFEAVNIAGVNAAALRQTRAGELSMWKGCAAAYAARHGIFSALLASEGVTGPKPIFEGELGYMKAISGPFNLPRLTPQATRILKTSIKWWPVEYHSMSAVEAATRIVSQIGRVKPEDVERVRVSTFKVSYNIIVKDPEKWRPKSRETADHSLPYITARTLLDGDIWLDSFEDVKMRDTAFLELAEKMRVEVDPRYDELYPEAVPNSVEVSLKGGRVYSEEVIHPKGHYKNPLTDEELRLKFARLTAEKLSPEELEDIWNMVMSLDRLRYVGYLMAPLSRL